MRSRSTIKDLARPSGVVALSILGPGLGSVVALSLAYANAEALRHGGIGFALLFVLLGGAAVGLTLLPTHALSLVSGWAFGFWGGLAVAYLGAILGTPTGYVVGKRLSGPAVAELISRHRQASAIFDIIYTAPLGKAVFLITLLRLSPIVPYGTTNILAAVMNVRLRAMVLGTLLGHGPRAAVVVTLGAGLESLNDQKPTNPWIWIAGLAATVLAVVLMGIFAKRALKQAATTG